MSGQSNKIRGLKIAFLLLRRFTFQTSKVDFNTGESVGLRPTALCESVVIANKLGNDLKFAACK